MVKIGAKSAKKDVSKYILRAKMDRSFKKEAELDMAVHICNPSTWEVEAGRSWV
jgi:hypothetical protein